MLEFNIRNQEISRIDNFLPAEKSVKYLIAKFNFKTEDWNETIKRAIFRNVKSKVEKDAMLEDDSCTVPWEVLVGSGDIEVSVHGISGTKDITTDVAMFDLNRTLQGGSATQEPSPTVYEQMLKKMQQTKEIAQSVRDDADNGEFNGEKGEKGDAGSIKFVIVPTLPTEDIDTSAMYLVPSPTEEDKNRFLEYVFVDGKPEIIGSASVEVNLDDYVKKDDYATGDRAGIVGMNKYGSYGLYMANDGTTIAILKASNSDIDNKNSSFMPIVPKNLDYAVKKALSDCKLSGDDVWTEEEKASARDTLGVTDLVGSVETILTELHTYAETKIGGEA